MEEGRGELAEFRAEVDGFSGPFDLLCWLVESEELSAAEISVGQAVRIYGAYLANTSRVSVSVVFDFMLMAASLVLNKIRSLLPDRCAEPDEDPVEISASEMDVLGRLARYRPYRASARHLIGLKEKRDRLFFRTQPEGDDGSPSLFLGDLYALCRLWWSLAESRRTRVATEYGEDDYDLEGAPTAVPDEEQVERKMIEILDELARSGALSLSSLLLGGRTMTNLVVTILALLEMSRTGRVRVTQEEQFGDVSIVPA